MRKILTLVVLLVLLLPIPTMAEEQNPFADMSNEELLLMQLSLKQELIARELLEPSLLYPGEYVVGVDIRPGTYRLSFVSATHSSIFVTHFKNVDQFKKAREGGFSTNVIRENDGFEAFVEVDNPMQFILVEGEVMRTNWGICYIESVEKPSWAL